MNTLIKRSLMREVVARDIGDPIDESPGLLEPETVDPSQPWNEEGIPIEERVVRYLTEHPEAGNRQIAKDLGVDKEAIVRARRKAWAGRPAASESKAPPLAQRKVRAAKEADANPETWVVEAAKEAGGVAVSNIAARAIQEATESLSTGEVIRKWFVEHGLQYESAGSPEMVANALKFWWSYRDRVGEMENTISELSEILEEVARHFEPAAIRERQFQMVLDRVTASVMAGSPMPEGVVDALMRAASRSTDVPNGG